MHYTAWLHWSPTTVCNLDCKYCINSIKGVDTGLIHIEALSKTLSGKPKLKITFTGGEPFLVPNFIEACEVITQNHVLELFSNLTSNKLREFSKRINPNKVEFVHASFHYDALKAQGLLDKFKENLNLLKENGFRIKLKAVAYPPLDYIAVKTIYPELRFMPYYGVWQNKVYPDAYTKAELKKFQLNSNCKQIFSRFGKPCNAGFNVAMVSPTGEIKVCAHIDESLGNIYTGFSFKHEPLICPKRKCECPFPEYDKRLFNEAIN